MQCFIENNKKNHKKCVRFPNADYLCSTNQAYFAKKKCRIWQITETCLWKYNSVNKTNRNTNASGLKGFCCARIFIQFLVEVDMTAYACTRIDFIGSENLLLMPFVGILWSIVELWRDGWNISEIMNHDDSSLPATPNTVVHESTALLTWEMPYSVLLVVQSIRSSLQRYSPPWEKSRFGFL